MMSAKEQLDRLKAVIESIGNEPIGIIMTQIDPDALACALGLSYLISEIRESGNGVEIYYCGGVHHPQNRTIMNKYDLKRIMKPIEEIGEDIQYTALVDSSSVADGRIPNNKEIEPIIVIDHHRDSQLPDKENTFYWITSVGAASTMVSELLEEAEIEITNEDKYILTLLALGIYTDTNALVNGSSRDRHAYGYTTQSTSTTEFAELINYPFPESHFQHLKQALANMNREGSRMITNLGSIPENNSDDISSIADYFLRMEGVSLVVVWGIIGDTVRISARSTDLSTPLEEFMEEKFGPKSGAKLDPAGRGEGGALIDLDLNFWLSENTRSEIENLVSIRLQELMFDNKSFPQSEKNEAND